MTGSSTSFDASASSVFRASLDPARDPASLQARTLRAAQVEDTAQAADETGFDTADRRVRDVSDDLLAAGRRLTTTALSAVYPTPGTGADGTPLTAADLGVAALFIAPSGEKLPTESLLRKLDGNVAVTTTVRSPEGTAVTIATQVVEQGENTRNLVRLLQGRQELPPQAGLNTFAPGLVLGSGFYS